MATEHILPIAGYRDHTVPNRLRQPDGTTGRLTLLLPGYGYTLDMPLFYYVENLCLDMGSDVLRMETAYSQHPRFGEATEPEQAQWVVADARATWQAGLKHADYASVMVVGKSLSTLAMAALLAPPITSPPKVRSVWLTPLLSQQSVRETLVRLGNSAQVVIGDADPHYDADVLADLAGAGMNVVVAPGADHGLDIPGDVAGSVRLLPQIISAIHDFGFRQG
jgi:hypothetical protein